MKKILLVLAMFTSLVTVAQTSKTKVALKNKVVASGIVFDHGNWDAVIAKAKKSNKLVFFDAYTTWCRPCKEMQSVVFPDKSVGGFFNKNFVSVKVDMESGEGPKLDAIYQVQAYPTMYFINPKNGKVVNQIVGYRSAPELKAIAEETMKIKI